MLAGKLFKRILLVTAIILGLVILSAVLIPILFKDKILAFVKTEMNDQLNATSDFKDVNLSLFHHFPNLTVSIEALSIANKAPFEGDTLISAKEISITVDLIKAIKGIYDIENISLSTPRIHALVNEQGQTNWNITKPDTTAKATNQPTHPFALKLQSYSISDGYIEYRDDQGKMYATINNLNHDGSGDFTSDNFTLRTHTTIGALSFAFGNISYLNKIKTVLDMDLQVDNKNNKYSFNTDKVQLNNLRLATKGYVQLPDTLNTVMDIQFSTPSNNFKDILSLVPGIYQNNFNDIKTTGSIMLNGFVKGTYNKTRIPAFGLNLAVQNGSFQYPALPSKVDDIQIKMSVNNPDGIMDHTVVNLAQGHMQFSGAPFDFRLLLKTPISAPYADAGIKGRIDLSQVQNFMKLEAGTKLAGIIDANASAKGPISAATKQQYDKLNAAGTISISNLYYTSKDYPEGVNIASLLLTFNPKNVSVSNLKAQYLQTNFTGNGSIDNLLGYYLHNDALFGILNVTADKINLDKWMGTTATSQPTTQTAATEPFIVPANLNVTLNALAGLVQYGNLALSNIKGSLTIKDQTVYLQKVTGQGLDGTIQIDGSYSTKADKKNPDIQFAYVLQGIDVQKTFTTFNTAQKLMPIAKYIAGKMNSEFTMQAKLGTDMQPVLNSLTGKGDLLLVDGVLSKFAPVDQLADKLNIAELKNVSLKDIKTYFHFENGRVTVDPYTFNIKDMTFEVAGSHGFDQTLQYGVNVTVPRSEIGSQGNALVNNLISQAKSKGITAQVGDKISFAVNIGGTITKPTIQTNLKQVAGDAVNEVKQQITAEANKRIDSAKMVMKDTVNAVKKQLADEAKNQLVNALQNKSKDTSAGNVNDVKKKTEESVKGALKNIFNKNK